MSKHFSDALEPQLPIHIFGTDYKRFANLKDKAEFRINGTNFNEISRNYFSAKLQVNIILKTVKDNDIHKKQKFAGLIQNSFTPSIKLYRYGDDELYFGCLEIQGEVDTIDLGEFDKDLVCTVSASYQAFLTN